MFAQFRIAFTMFVMLSVITGMAYPAVVTVIAQLVWPHQANGSLIVIDGKKVGSELIGQSFESPKYFWSRPSSTGPVPYNGEASSGSNLGPLNPELKVAIEHRVQALQQNAPDQKIPVDLVTSSGSGLDPHISPAAAFFQVKRIAEARQMDEESVNKLVETHIESREWGILGEPRINVLKLNLALDTVTK